MSDIFYFVSVWGWRKGGRRPRGAGFFLKIEGKGEWYPRMWGGGRLQGGWGGGEGFFSFPAAETPTK